MAMNIDAAVNISADVSGQQAVDKLADSLKKMGNQGEASAKQVANAMRMVPAQLTDIATQLAGGQSPFLIMMQQGGQLRDMFGSISGALLGVGRTISVVLTPINAVVAAIGVLSYAAYRGNQDYLDLANKLTLTGNAAGYTAGQIEKMAKTLSDTAGVSAGKARDLVAGLAGTGQFVGKNLDLAEETAARVQKLTGQTSDEVVKDFATMSKGVAAWAAEHNRSYNYLTAAEFQHIKELEEMGNKEGAMRANMDALNKAFSDRKAQLGYIEQAWKGITEWAAKGWAAMLNIGKPETNEDKLDALKKQLASVEALASRPMAGGLQGPEKAAYEQRRAAILEQMRLLQKGIDKENSDAQEKAKAAATEREKIDEIQSGKLAAMQNASIQKRLEQLKGAAEAEIGVLEQSAQRIENQYRAGLMSEEQYNAGKLRIAKEILNKRIELAQQEEAVERQRPTSSKADVIQRETKALTMQNEQAKLRNELELIDLKAAGDRAAFVRQMEDAVKKFGNAQQTRIEQIKLEAEAAGMSTLDYKKHTEALRIDKEAADAASGKSPEWVAAIMAEAEAKKAATKAALEKADADRRAFGSGANDAMKDYVENVANAANGAKTLFSNAFKGMEDALVNFVKTGKLNFASLADSLISDMIRMAIQAQITGPLVAAAKGMSWGSLLNGFTGTDAGGYSSAAAEFANGGIMTPFGSMPLNTYANGGVANSPQMAIFGEGRTPEAYVPLPDGRHIPVAMQGGGGGSNVVVNVVNNANGTKASAQERQDGNGQRIIDVVIEQVKASIAGDITRGVGTVTSALERTYGANRAAGAY